MVLHGRKTYYSCIDSAAEFVSETGVSPSENVVIFCEDKLTLSMETAVAKRLGGTFNTEVLSFGRYVSSKTALKNVLTKESSAIVVKKILGNIKGKLKALSKLASSPSFAFETSELIAQLKSAKVTPREITEALDGCRENVRAKISDVALVYSEYEKFLKEKGLSDQSGALDEMPALLKADKKIKGSKVVIVGYSSLTRQICEIIKILSETALSVDVFAVKGSNENLYCNEFYEFIKRLDNTEIKTDKTEILSPEQESVLNGLFDHHRFAKVGLYSDKIHIFEAKNIDEEIDFIAKRITYLVTAKGMRYSDFCLAAGDMGKYSLRIKRTFEDYKIPCFSDEKRQLSSHPLSRLVTGFLKAGAKSADMKEIRGIISNPLFISDKDISDLFIRELIGRTVTGRLFLDKTFPVSEDIFISAKRDVLASSLGKLKRKDGADEYVKIILEFIENAYVSDNAKLTEEKLLAINANEESAFLTSAIDKVTDTVKKAGEVLGNDEVTISEFCKLLEAGFDACEVGLIPQFSDCVYVAELKDCRFKRFRYLFTAGLNGDVPFIKSDTALLLDSDIADLEKLSVAIEPKISVVNKREKEAAGLAFASFSDGLFMSYSLLSPSGNQTVKSDVLDFMERIFVDKNGKPLEPFNVRSYSIAEEEEKGEKKDIYESVGYLRLRPAYFSLIKDSSDFKNGAISSLSAASSFLAALKTYADGDKFSYAKRLLQRVDKQIAVKKKLPPENYFALGRVSASKIECYYSCPYKCFIKYCLGAADRITDKVRSLDFGNVLHNIAENFVKRMDEADTDEKAEILAEEVISAALSDPEIQKFAHRGDFAYALKLTEKEGKKLCKGIYEEFKQSGFRPVGEEVWFSDWSEYKSLPLVTKKGERYKLYGKADRIDKYKNYVRIIDYKTGNVTEKVKEEKFYTGQNIQLYLYMNAFVKESEEPAGAYYYAVNDSFKKADDDRTVMAGKTLFTDEVLTATDKTVIEKGKSELINVKTDRRNGKLSGSLCDGVELQGYMKYAKKLAENAVSDIADGVMIASPYEDTCKYCEYGSICGYDEEAGYRERKVKDVKSKTIVEAAYSDEQAGDRQTGKETKNDTTGDEDNGE